MSNLLFLLDVAVMEYLPLHSSKEILDIFVKLRCVSREWKQSVDYFLKNCRNGRNLFVMKSLYEDVPFGYQYIYAKPENELERHLIERRERCAEGCLFAKSYLNNNQKSISGPKCIHQTKEWISELCWKIEKEAEYQNKFDDQKTKVFSSVDEVYKLTECIMNHTYMGNSTLEVPYEMLLDLNYILRKKINIR